jgi:hypothetical protein
MTSEWPTLATSLREVCVPALASIRWACRKMNRGRRQDQNQERKVGGIEVLPMLHQEKHRGSHQQRGDQVMNSPAKSRGAR